MQCSKGSVRNVLLPENHRQLHSVPDWIKTVINTLPPELPFLLTTKLLLVSISHIRSVYFPTNSDMVRIGFSGRKVRVSFRLPVFAHACATGSDTIFLNAQA